MHILWIILMNFFFILPFFIRKFTYLIFTVYAFVSNTMRINVFSLDFDLKFLRSVKLRLLRKNPFSLIDHTNVFSTKY